MNAKNRGLIGILVLVLIVAFSTSPAFAAKGGVGQGVATHYRLQRRSGCRRDDG